MANTRRNDANQQLIFSYVPYGELLNFELSTKARADECVCKNGTILCHISKNSEYSSTGTFGIVKICRVNRCLSNKNGIYFNPFIRFKTRKASTRGVARIMLCRENRIWGPRPTITTTDLRLLPRILSVRGVVSIWITSGSESSVVFD